MSQTPEPWHNLIAYPNFKVDSLNQSSMFWQFISNHPFYSIKNNGKQEGLSINNLYHEPVIVQNGLWGNRLFLENNVLYKIGLQYSSKVKIFLGINELHNNVPKKSWTLMPNGSLNSWKEEFSFNDIPEGTPHHIKIMIPDTQMNDVELKNLFVSASEEMEIPDVAIGIVTFNRRDHLTSLLRQIETINYPKNKIKVVVVNNASTDDTLEAVPPKFPWLKMLTNKVNTGGSGGFNTFFKYLLSLEFPPEMAWLIDDDASIEKNTLINLVKALNKNKTAAVAGSVMMDLEHPSIVWEAGGSLFDDRIGWKANILHAEAKDLTHIRDQFWEVGYAGAYSLLFRTEVLSKVGIWRDYFLHVDDSEWCYRIQRITGKKIIIALDSLIWHVLQGTKKPFTTLRYYESRNFLDFFSNYTEKQTIFKVMTQCVKMGLRQKIIKREDLCSFHLKGIDDFYDSKYGEKILERSAVISPDIQSVVDEYYRQKKTMPPKVLLFREINQYANDGIDHESKIMEKIREVTPETKILEVGHHKSDTILQQSNAFYHFKISGNKYINFIKMLFRILFPKKGIVVLPFWNEAIIPNNLASLTAVYEDGKFSLYWTDRKKLFVTFFVIFWQSLKWSIKTYRGFFDPKASHVKTNKS